MQPRWLHHEPLLVGVADAASPSERGSRMQLMSEIPGNVYKVLIGVGATVKAGETLVIIESMKMEIAVDATHAGVVLEIFVQEGDQVEQGSPLVRLEDAEGASHGD